MERIANPVTGRVDADWRAVATDVPLSQQLCRYALGVLTPILVAVAVQTAEHLPWWVPLALYAAVLLPLSAGAHGSWWRPAPWSAWQAGGLLQALALLLGLAAAIVSGETLVMVVVAAVMVGVVLGVGASQLWRARQRGAQEARR